MLPDICGELKMRLHPCGLYELLQGGKNVEKSRNVLPTVRGGFFYVLIVSTLWQCFHTSLPAL